MRVDYTARANAHYRWAERYNRNGKEAKAMAHFGRALEYDKGARSDPAFGIREYGENKLFPADPEMLEKFPEFPRRRDDLRVETLLGVGPGGTDFAIPVVGSGMFVEHSVLREVYQLVYKATTDVITKEDLANDPQEKKTFFEIRGPFMIDGLQIKKQFCISNLGKIERRYFHYSWIPRPRTAPDKACHFIKRIM